MSHSYKAEAGKVPFDGFDWDTGNIPKARKHGVDPGEIERFFQQEVLVIEDERHSQNERRFIAAGQSKSGRALFVAFTFRRRGESILIRVISARPMHEKENQLYETLRKKSET